MSERILLTTPEITALWTTYIQNSATTCFYTHFLQHIQDNEIRPLIEEILQFEESNLAKIKSIFEAEQFPVPRGFSDKDVDLSAPALYTDLFSLSFIYRVGQMSLPSYATFLTKVARKDLVDLFHEFLTTSTVIYEKCLHLMLAKGIYDRPPKIIYPLDVQFMTQGHSFLDSWFGEQQPMNVIELSELFFAIERNYIGVLLMMGLIQVTHDKNIKEYLIKGKTLAEKQIEVFNKMLKEDEQLGCIPLSMEVTNSTTPPFSDHLIMFLVTATTAAGISSLASALGTSMRKDLAARYLKIIAEIISYSSEGFNVMVERGWLEQPPQPVNRHDLYKS
ncbi:DUF3231 family protein [Ectobacillus sp. JY-23]|uniref:DUF3231 family protein n=1 Tax=Ectobacillus sp. JY-23 TaxID=2933872 RepID=UPI001FF155DD|nr:DUF3231 family protein [Ectobacillus sp. JY-23]UOY91042.1 DUF3231 family protein [Ectobacillus sp. JY-23]